MRQHPYAREQGITFISVVFLSVVATVLVGAFFTTSLGKIRDVERQISEASAFNAAESGLGIATEALWTVYRNEDPRTRVDALDRYDGKNDPDDRYVLADCGMGRSTFNVRVEEVNVNPGEYADVLFVSEGTNRFASRRVTAVVRYGSKPSEVFDHAYFINNFGWLWGAGITVNGSVRSNANFSVKSAVVNGDLWASENEDLGASGTIEGDVRQHDLDYYNDHQGDRARPTNPSATPEDANGNGILDPGEDVNGNGVLDTFEYEDGYDGEPDRYDHMPSVDMPYLGDLETYRKVAIAKGGTLSQGGTVIVDAVLGDDAGEDQNLILIGTDENPIVIDGPVVIANDVVLKGKIKGQGTIYAGRNVHIIGSLEYVDPPVWPKPITDGDALNASNAKKDMVGLSAKGSVILGDYTGSEWLATTKRYQTPPFTQAYEVDPSDAANGYVSYTDEEGRPMFDGDYRAYDGGMKDDGEGGNEPRKFYESSFADDVIRDKADEQVRTVDAIIYTNHLLSGKVGAATFNGTLVSRDEAIIYDGNLFINYDIRTRQGNYEFLDVYLPREPDHRIVYWGESK